MAVCFTNLVDLLVFLKGLQTLRVLPCATDWPMGGLAGLRSQLTKPSNHLQFGAGEMGVDTSNQAILLWLLAC
jgi:hypothetical protein